MKKSGRFVKYIIVIVAVLLHMIPVDQDSPVTEISLDSYFISKNSLCSYEKAGQNTKFIPLTESSR